MRVFEGLVALRLGHARRLRLFRRPGLRGRPGVHSPWDRARLAPSRLLSLVPLLAPASVLALWLLPALPAFAADPFKGITDVIFGSARTWAGALLVVGLIGVAIRFMTGDPDSNVQTRNFLWGSIACIAAGLGLGVYDWVASWAGVR